MNYKIETDDNDSHLLSAIHLLLLAWEYSRSWQAIVRSRFLLARIIEGAVWYYMFCGVLLDSLSLFFYTFWANAIIINQFNFIRNRMKIKMYNCQRRCKLEKVMPGKTGYRTAKSNRVLLQLGISIELNLKFESTKFFIQPTDQLKSVF